jgi:hypothetical protein
LVRLGHPKGGLGQQVGCRTLVQIQQILPRLAGLGRRIAGQQRFAQPKAGLDHQGVIDVLAEELAVQLRGLGEFVQLLLALGDQQFQSYTAFQLRTDAKRTAVEIECLCVVGLLVLLGRLEIGVRIFQVDVGDFLLAIFREQERRLGAISQLGVAKVAFARVRQAFGKPGLSRPRAVGEGLVQLVERGHRLVVFFLEMQRPAFQVRQIVLVQRLVLCRCVDRRNRFRVFAILQQLVDRFRHLGGCGRQAACRQTKRTHRDQRRCHTCTEHDGPSPQIGKRSHRPILQIYTGGDELGRISGIFV